MPPEPVPYLSELELLSSLRRFFVLVPCFLITFSSFSNFLLICTKEFFAGLGFFLPFLAVQKLAFSDPSFSYLQQPFVFCILYTPPRLLQRLDCFLMQSFYGTLAVDSAPGLLVPFMPLLEAFLLDGALDFSCAHTRSIVSRDIRSKHMSTGVLVKVEMVLPCKWAHPKSVTCQTSLR
jgi:hypothetical protein